MTDPQPRQDAAVDRHLWQVTAVRDLFWITLALGVLWLVGALSAVLTPVAIAFVLAYLCDPLVTRAKRYLGWNRAFTTALMLVVLVGAAVAFTWYLFPIVVDQLSRLEERGPKYIELVGERLNVDVSAWLEEAQPTTQEMRDNSGAIAGNVLRGAAHVLGFLGVVLSVAAYLAVGSVLIAIFFGFFSWRFNELPNFKRYLPASNRERWWDLCRQIELAFAGFFRGQIIVAMFTTVGFAIGFYVTGVPYWILAAFIGGALSIIPYGQIAGPATAIGLKYLDYELGNGGEVYWVWIFLGPLIVYAITQSLETWVITPWVQSWSTRLHPLVILVAIIGGGSIGGLLGMFFAIPLAATGKILLREIVLPKLGKWAEAH